jgi:hypothetical protein
MWVRVRSQYAPWITNNIRQVMRQRDYLKKKAVKTGSKQFHDAYRRTRRGYLFITPGFEPGFEPGLELGLEPGLDSRFEPKMTSGDFDG